MASSDKDHEHDSTIEYVIEDQHVETIYPNKWSRYRLVALTWHSVWHHSSIFLLQWNHQGTVRWISWSSHFDNIWSWSWLSSGFERKHSRGAQSKRSEPPVWLANERWTKLTWSLNIEELPLYQLWMGSRNSNGCMGLGWNLWGPHQSCGTRYPIVMALNLSDLST